MKTKSWHFLRTALGLLALAPLTGFTDTLPPQSPADPAPISDKEAPTRDYVRIAEDASSSRMETAVTSFTLPDGRIVDLFGVVHLGDGSYYKDINERLGTYDAVLFELVGDPSALQNPPPSDPDAPAPRAHPLRSFQQGVGRVFKLKFQLENIDYTRPNFVHADTSAEEFNKMQEDRGESMMKLMMKSFQLSNDATLRGKLSEAENLGLGDLIMLFYSDKSMQRIKLIFARLLAESEVILESKLLAADNAIIAGRNEVALAKLDEVLADPAKKRVAIFYGAGHMPSMEATLTENLKAVRSGETWLSAWTMPAAKKAEEKSLTPSDKVSGGASITK